jgi:hypothetical protein
MAPTAAPDLGRAYLAKKSIDLTTELLGLDAQQLRSDFNILRRRAGADTDLCVRAAAACPSSQRWADA